MNHNNKCKMAFGKPTKLEGQCPRCDELRAGATPRAGWSVSKRAQDNRFQQDLKSHNCARSGCGYVCTFGEW